MKMTIRSALWIAIAATLAACGGRMQPAPITTTTGPARVTQIVTAPGVSIEVLDWGGSGRPLVFLGGGGHTAREFEDFAPLFAGGYRVIGISRRGSGGSSDVPPASLDDLTRDIAAVMDSLRFPSAVLIGHSFAGVEMARFGEAYGGRCAGLVYLDAAYDYTDPDLPKVFETAVPPDPPAMTAADSASADAVAAWVMRTSGFRQPVSEIRATRQFSADGRLVGHVPSQTQRRMGELVRAPKWDAIKCPSLGMYAIPQPPETGLRWYAQLDSAGQAQARAYYRAFAPWTAGQRAKFGHSPGNRVIEFPSGNHYFFLEHPRESSRMILNWLATLP